MEQVNWDTIGSGEAWSTPVGRRARETRRRPLRAPRAVRGDGVNQEGSS